MVLQVPELQDLLVTAGSFEVLLAPLATETFARLITRSTWGKAHSGHFTSTKSSFLSERSSKIWPQRRQRNS